MPRLSILALLPFLLAGCGPNQSTDHPGGEAMGDGLVNLDGEVVFAEPAAELPPDAVIKISLADVSRADAPSVKLAQAVLGPEARAPYTFSLAYDPATIDPRFRYAVQARIESGGGLAYINTEHIDAFANGEKGPVSVRVHRVGGAGAVPP